MRYFTLHRSGAQTAIDSTNSKLAQRIRVYRSFSILEIILAAGIFILVAISITTLLLQTIDVNRNSLEQTIAYQYAQEGLEIARSVRNQAYAGLVSTAQTGTSNSGGTWTFSGTTNTFDKYTRSLSIQNVNRDALGNIVTSGGTLDNNTKKITSTVTWTHGGARTQNISLSTYLTNWKQPISGTWNNPTVQSSLDLLSTSDAVGITVAGNYAYVIRSTSASNFHTINISNLASPSVTATVPVTSTPTGLAKSLTGNYAVISTTSNSAELSSISVSNPASPSVAGSYNAASNFDARQVFISGTRAYLTQLVGPTNHEFHIVNVTTPTSPTLLGGLSLSGNPQGVFVLGNYAYVASANDSQELQIINVSNPASPSLTGSMNLSGTSDGYSVAAFSNYVLLGRVDGSVAIINVSNPASPTLTGTFAGSGGVVRGIDLNDDGSLAFLATSSTTAEFQVLDLSTISTPTLRGSINLPAGLYDVKYSSSLDRCFLASSEDTREFIIVSP